MAGVVLGSVKPWSYVGYCHKAMKTAFARENTLRVFYVRITTTTQLLISDVSSHPLHEVRRGWLKVGHAHVRPCGEIQKTGRS